MPSGRSGDPSRGTKTNSGRTVAAGAVLMGPSTDAGRRSGTSPHRRPRPPVERRPRIGPFRSASALAGRTPVDPGRTPVDSASADDGPVDLDRPVGDGVPREVVLDPATR